MNGLTVIRCNHCVWARAVSNTCQEPNNRLGGLVVRRAVYGNRPPGEAAESRYYPLLCRGLERTCNRNKYKNIHGLLVQKVNITYKELIL